MPGTTIRSTLGSNGWDDRSADPGRSGLDVPAGASAAVDLNNCFQAARTLRLQRPHGAVGGTWTISPVKAVCTLRLQGPPQSDHLGSGGVVGAKDLA